MFENAGEFARIYPGEASPHWRFCAPRIEDGPQLAKIRLQLAVAAAADVGAFDAAIDLLLREAARLIARRAQLGQRAAA
jgi:hypothetical protein